MMIKVILVDDHAVVRAGYRMLLQNSEEIEIVAEVETGEQACKAYVDYSPHVVVMDISLPGMGGLEAIRRIVARDGEANILVFSMHENTVFVDQALNAGAKGYITKNSAPDVLISAIKEIANGGVFLAPDIAQHLAFQKARGQDTPFSHLSTREFEIFCLLAEGLNTAQIAKRLSLSYKTVSNYTTQIKSKLNVSSVAEIARMAISHDIVQL